MARCGCSSTSGCACVVTGGSGIQVGGAGTGADPYVIEATGTSISGTLTVTDTATVDLTLGGSGSVSDPYDLSAVATLATSDLTDAPAEPPEAGDTWLWDGTKWVYGPPSSGGGGTTIVSGAGLTGVGSATDPVVADVAGTWGVAPLNRYGSNTTLGAPVYVDANGQLRSQPLGVQVLTAGQNRPTQYPGRVIVQDGVAYYSTGSVWVELTSAVEGPYTLDRAAFLAAGFTFAANTSAADASYLEFSRVGSTVFFYWSAFTHGPVEIGLSGNITNRPVLTWPAALVPAQLAGGITIGGTGPGAFYLLDPDGGELIMNAVVPPHNGNDYGDSATWSASGSYPLPVGVNAYDAFAVLRDNAVEPARALQVHQIEFSPEVF